MDWKPGNNIPGVTNDFDITKISDTISQWLIHRGHMGHMSHFKYKYNFIQDQDTLVEQLIEQSPQHY